jgi:hypothetical protein
MSESTIRPSGFYWIEDAGGEPEPARWDAEGEFWVLLGTEEGQADARCDRARAGAGAAVMLRPLRVWLRRINEARQARRDAASFGRQLASAKRKQSDLKRLDKEFGKEPSERRGQ